MIARFESAVVHEDIPSWNHGQCCCAGSRIFVQSGIYDEFLRRFTAKSQSIKLGDPFAGDSQQGPQISQIQFDVGLSLSLHCAYDTDGKITQRIMGYINSGKQQGATVHLGGERHGTEGYWIQPTIFTDTTPDMRIVKEEIFGPVGVVIKFEDEEDVLRQANDTTYGLAAAVFSLGTGCTRARRGSTASTLYTRTCPSGGTSSPASDASVANTRSTSAFSRFRT